MTVNRQDMHENIVVSRTIRQTDITNFATLSGDFNPIHIDPEYAASTRFGRPIAHGMYLGALISGVLATDLPGPGAIYISQDLRFLKPVFIGDTVKIEISVISYENPDKVHLRTQIRNFAEELLVDGTATLKVPKSK